MLFKDFADYLAKLEKISSRNEMTEILAELFSKLATDEIKQAVYLLSGRVAPSFLPIEFNFSVKLSVKALAVFFEQSDQKTLAEYKKVGDVGGYIESKTKTLKPFEITNLTINQVFDELEKLALLSGKNSQTDKQQIFIKLLKQLTPIEAKFVARMLVGKMRLGLSNKTVFDALSWAIGGDKRQRELIEYACGVSVDIGEIATLALTKGVIALKTIHAVPGTPVASKLVEREKSAAAIIERLGDCFIQPKFDGLRVQIHYNKQGFAAKPKKSSDLELFQADSELETVRIFSRNLESLTDMFPDIVAAAKKLPVDNIILDGEAIGFNVDDNTFLDFQETIKRKRKYDVVSTSEDVPLQVNLFDILYLNNQDLLPESIETRILKLEEVFGKNAYSMPQGMFKLAETTLVKTTEQVEELFNKYVQMNLEGLIAKDDATLYKPGSRNFDWIKLKASSDKRLVDTIDAVVLGYYFGEGDRAQFGIGAILIGVYDRDKDRFLSLTKVGSGFKEADWAKIKATLDEYRLDELPDNYGINKMLLPDVLVAPKVVVEVEADSISISKNHGGADKKAYSLRFPRLKVFGRDKNAQEATTVAELKQLYALQQRK